MDSYLDDGLVSTLAEGAEVGAALGGRYHRVTWDSGRVFASTIDTDAAYPTFTWGRLTAVTFWHVLAIDGQAVTRHVERHELDAQGDGVVLHGLYIGTSDRLGQRHPLNQHPATAHLTVDADGALIGTRTPGLMVEYIPNQTPNRRWRKDTIGRNLGRSDFDGIEPLMDALDEAYSPWMRDVRNGKGRILAAESMLDDHGPGRGASLDLDRGVFVGLPGLLPDRNATALPIQVVQFAIRVEEHLRTCQQLVEDIFRSAGYSAQTFGEGPDSAAMTATEVQSRERRSYLTRNRKLRHEAPRAPPAPGEDAADRGGQHDAVRRAGRRRGVRRVRRLGAGLPARARADVAGSPGRARRVHEDARADAAPGLDRRPDRCRGGPHPRRGRVGRPRYASLMSVDPGYGERLAYKVSDLYAAAQMTVLRRIATALVRGEDGPEWARTKMLELDLIRRRFARDLGQLENDVANTVPLVLREAYLRGQALAILDTDLVVGSATLPPATGRAVDRLAEELLGVLAPVHTRALRAAADVYQRAVADAAVVVLTGAGTRRDAAQDAVTRLTANGLTGFTDRSQRRWSLDTYAEMATRSATGRAAVDGHVDQLQVSGLDLVVVSDAPRECPLCRPWEGKVLSLGSVVGSVIERPSLVGGPPVRVAVAGTLDEARGGPHASELPPLGVGLPARRVPAAVHAV